MDTSYPKITPATKRILYLIGIIAILIPVLLTYVLLYPPMFATNISTSQSSTQTSTSSSAQGVTITIPAGIGDDKALNFQSDNVTVAPGTTITWVNDDTSTHDIDFTATPSGVTLATSPNSPSWTNNMYSVTLTVPGTYSYKCDYHSWMTGTITVTGSTTTNTGTSSTSTSSSSSSSATGSNSTTSSGATSTSATSSSSTASGPMLEVVYPSGIANNPSMKVEYANGTAFTSATVTPGTTIVFVNQDTTAIHDVDFTGVPSGVTLPGNPSANTNKWTNNEVEFTLTTAGTYTFVCDYHNWMTGTITVT